MQREQSVREKLGVSTWPDLLAVMQQSAPVAQISQLHGLQTYYGELDIRGGHCCSSYPAIALSANRLTTPTMLLVAGLLLSRGGQQAAYPWLPESAQAPVPDAWALLMGIASVPASRGVARHAHALYRRRSKEPYQGWAWMSTLGMMMLLLPDTACDAMGQSGRMLCLMQGCYWWTLSCRF